MMVAVSVGSPTLRKPAICTSPSRTWSNRLRCTTARVGAVQIWPEWNDHVEPMQPMAPFTSASSKTTQAPLPPSSSSVRFMVRAAFSAMVTPTWVEPVKLTQSTSSASTSAAEEAGPFPLTRLTTPGGKPTSLQDAHQLHDGQRVLRRRLDHHGVAGRQRRRHLARPC